MRLERMLGACLAALLWVTAAPAAVSTDHPLLMKGKKTLYQRVLAKPGAMMVANLGDEVMQKTTPFSVFYVYDRKPVDGVDWLQLGVDRYGKRSGWVRNTELIPWNQTLTVSFLDPKKHNRVLLFKDKASLKSMIENSDTSHYKATYRAAVDNDLPKDSPVVAIQPAESVDITKDFYLVPIIDHEDVYLGSEAATMLEVTSVPLASRQASVDKADGEEADSERSDPAEATADGDDAAAVEAGKRKAAAQKVAAAREQAMTEALKQYKSGLVFVIDSTKSMGPYIDRTRQAVREIYKQLEKSGVTSGMSFGVVAYRDATEAVKGLGYRVKVVADLKSGQEADAFFKEVDQLKAAEVSSQDFVEDAYAGVSAALDKIDWQGQDARYVILITDAGARGPNDPLSGTKQDAAKLARLAREKGVVLSVLHLLTPAGVNNHSAAATQYRALSTYPGIGSLYYGVPAGDVAAYGKAVDALAGQISGQVREMVSAQVEKSLPAQAVVEAEPEPEAKKPVEPQSVPQAEKAAAGEGSLKALQEKFRKLGYALRMQYLQKQKNGAVPEVFNAWLVDHDFINPEQPTLDVRVLLTRDQLSDLHDLMRQVIDTFEEGLITPKGFINNIKQLAATMSRNPEKLNADDAGSSLSEMGFMQEYIEDLPYRSEAMSLTLEDWADWPAKRQIDYINRLEDKIAYYKSLYDHTDLWVSLNGGPVNGQSVFPVELQMLP